MVERYRKGVCVYIDQLAGTLPCGNCGQVYEEVFQCLVVTRARAQTIGTDTRIGNMFVVDQ
jgi:hypothetical protein